MISTAFSLVSLFALATPQQNLMTETLYEKYYQQFESKQNIAPSSEFSRKVFVDALWDFTMRTEQKPNIALIQTEEFSIFDQVRLTILKAWPKRAQISKSMINQIIKNRDTNAAFLVFTHKSHLAPSEWMSILQEEFHEEHQQVERLSNTFSVKSNEELKDLFFNSPDLSNVMEGNYKDGIRIFMFCRKNRAYKCLLLMKDSQNQPVYLKNSRTLWHHPALGKSKLDRPSWKRNGDTPAGVHTLDSVMPTANKQKVFGKFRRVIMNFVPATKGEHLQKKFLPASAKNKDWWQPAVVARNVGRNLLRIHGTGTVTSQPSDPNHPLRPTFGCVMQREMLVDGVEYKDQRLLLDEIMQALKLTPKYANEEKIKGVFYLIDIDNKKKAVTYKDVAKKLGIK